MSDWKKVKLNKVLKQYRIEHWVQDGKMYKQVTISKYDGVVYRGEKKGNEIGRKRQFIIDLDKYPNTLLFVRQGLEDGGIGLAPKEVNQCIATENMPMFSVEGIETEYLNIFLKSEVFKAQVRALEQTGSAQKSIHEKQLMELEIPLPSVTEQKELIKKFKIKRESFTSITSELKTQQTLITQLRQSILQEAVQGKLVKQNKNDEPASELLKRIKAEKEKLIKQGKLKKEKPLPPISENEIPFQLSEGWVWCRLGEVIKVVSGFSFNSSDFIKTEGVKCVKITNAGVRELIETEDYLPINFKEKYKNFLAFTGDLIIALTRPYISEGLKISQCTESYNESLVNQRVAVLRPFVESLNTEYVYLFMRTNLVLDYYKLKFAKRSQQPNLKVEDITHLIFPLPPLPEQKRIVEKVNQLMQHCNELEQQVQQSITHARQLMQAVLREVFEGKSEPLIVAD